MSRLCIILDDDGLVPDAPLIYRVRRFFLPTHNASKCSSRGSLLAEAFVWLIKREQFSEELIEYGDSDRIDRNDPSLLGDAAVGGVPMD